MPYSEEQINSLNSLSADDLKLIILNNRRVIEDLLQHWSQRLEQYQLTPHVAKDMDPSTSMGVQHGRTVSLKLCISDLKNCTKI